LVDMKWIPLISRGPKANTTMGNDSVSSEGVVGNANGARNESLPLKENVPQVTKHAGKWRPLDETEILKAANVSKVTRRGTREIDTKKSFDLSMPTKSILLERKLRSAEGPDEKGLPLPEGKHDTRTHSKCDYPGKSEMVAMLWLENAEIEPQIIENESGAVKAKLLIGREKKELMFGPSPLEAIRPVGDHGTNLGGPSKGVEVHFNSSRKNTTMNVGGTSKVGVAKDVRIWTPIHQELLFMISRDGPRFQSSLDFSLSSDQWDKPLKGSMKIVDTQGKSVSVPLIEGDPSAKSDDPEAKRRSSVSAYLSIRYLMQSPCSTLI